MMRRLSLQLGLWAMIAIAAPRMCLASAATRPATQPAIFPSDTDFSEPADTFLAPSKTPNAEAPELQLYNDMPIVVAAGKREQTQREAPASVSVVTEQDIDLFGYRSLADVLRDQRGFYLQTDGLNWFAGVRGFLRPDEWNARMLVLVDGRPTNEVIFGEAHLDLDFVVPMEAVKRVEIIRGPGSALYGSDAVFAVVNVVTKDGAEVNGVQAKVSGGTLGTGRIDALAGFKTKDDWDILANVSGYTSNGDDQIHYDGVNDPAHNFGNIVDSDYEGVYSAFVKAKKGEFTATFDLESRQVDNSAATYLTSWFNPGSMHEDRGNITFKIDHPVGPDQTFHAMAYYGQYSYNQHLPTNNGTPDITDIYDSTAADKWFGEELNYDWQLTKHVHLLAGAEGTQTIEAKQLDVDALQGNLINSNNSYSDFGVFAEAQDTITPWLSLTAGGRMDQVQRIGQSYSPRFAAILTPNNSDTVKAMYGRAFRRPNLYELFYSSPGSNTANPGLRPEICDTYEVDWEHQFPDGLSTTLDGYLWRLGNTINGVALPDGTDQFQNVGTSWAHGIEGEIDKKWHSGATFRAYGDVSSAQFSGQNLTHSPQWIVGSAFAFPIIGNNTFLSIDPQIVGPMKSDLGQYTRATYVTNIVLTSHDIFKNTDMQLGLYNLFGDSARLPQGNQFDQFQPTLNWPTPLILASITYHF
jgi:iron complex outermembrane receptor protein